MLQACQSKNLATSFWSIKNACQTYLQIRCICRSSFLCTKDFYQVLGISRKATSKEIKHAYFKLAKKYHPDANPGNKEASKKFQEISQAYEVLGNKDKKQQYDTFGSQESTNPFRSSRSYQSGYNPFENSQQWTYNRMSEKDAEELFNNIFKNFTSSSGGQTGHKHNMFNSIMSKLFTGVGSKIMQEMMKDQNFTKSKFYSNVEYEIKQGPNGIEFVKKTKNKK